jgi:hypothetical protein
MFWLIFGFEPYNWPYVYKRAHCNLQKSLKFISGTKVLSLSHSLIDKKIQKKASVYLWLKIVWRYVPERGDPGQQYWFIGKCFFSSPYKTTHTVDR